MNNFVCLVVVFLVSCTMANHSDELVNVQMTVPRMDCEQQLSVALSQLHDYIDQLETLTRNYDAMRVELSQSLEMVELFKSRLEKETKKFDRMAEVNEELRVEIRKLESYWMLDLKPLAYFAIVFIALCFMWFVLPLAISLVWGIVKKVYWLIVNIRTIPRRIRSRVRVYLRRFDIDEDEIQMEEVVPTETRAINIAIKNGEMQIPHSGSSESVFRLTRDNYSTFTPEAMQKGSPLLNVKTWPSFICQVYGVDEEDSSHINYLGNAFWVEDYIFTARHVLEAAPSGAVRLMNPRDPKKTIEVDRNLFKILPFDVAALMINQNVVSKLGLSKAKHPAMLMDSKMYVGLYGRENQTHGMLQCDQTAMGHLIYTGSSLKGFSGSPYVSGTVVYGMHVGSHSEAGFGYDIVYMLAAAEKEFNRVLESSEDYILGEIVRIGKKVKYQTYGLDEIKFVHRGRIYIVDNEDIRENDELWSFLEPENKKWSDYEPEHFVDAERPHKSIQRLAKNSLSQEPVGVPGKVNHVESALPKGELQQLAQKLSQLQEQMASLMAGLESMRAQQNVVLQSTSQNSKQQPSGNPRQKGKKQAPSVTLSTIQ
nr:hypothetical protein [Solemoviridae sp.]